MHVAALSNVDREKDKLKELYDSVTEARREAGADPVSLNKFTELVKSQMGKFQASGSEEVAFRVTVKDGKVKLTAKPKKS